MSVTIDEPTYARLRKARDLIRWIEEHGASVVRTFNKGSHSTWRGPNGKHFTIVAHNLGDELPCATIKQAVKACGGTVAKSEQGHRKRYGPEVAETSPQDGPHIALKQERIETSGERAAAGVPVKPEPHVDWECSRCHLDFFGEKPKSGMCKRCEELVAQEEPIPERPPARPIVWSLPVRHEEPATKEWPGDTEAPESATPGVQAPDADVTDARGEEPKMPALVGSKQKRLDPKYKCDKEGCEFETDWPPAKAHHILWHQGKHNPPPRVKRPCPKCGRPTGTGVAFTKHVNSCKGDAKVPEKKAVKSRAPRPTNGAAPNMPITPAEAFLRALYPGGIAFEEIGRAFRFAKKFEVMCEETQGDALEVLGRAES